MTDQTPQARKPEYVIVRICSCGKVSLRDGDVGGDAVSLTASEAKPPLDAISDAYVPGTAGSTSGLSALPRLLRLPGDRTSTRAIRRGDLKSCPDT